MSKRPTVRRIYEVDQSGLVEIWVSHGMLDGAPCVVLEDAQFPSGQALLRHIELIAGYYLVEIMTKGLCTLSRRPGFVQYRHSPSPRSALAQGVFEQVRMDFDGARFHRARWEPMRGHLAFSERGATAAWWRQPTSLPSP